MTQSVTQNSERDVDEGIVENDVPFKRNKKRRKPRLKRIIFIISFLLMPTLNFLIFYVYVNGSSFLMAFQKSIDGQTVWGFMNFVQFFQEFSTEGSEMAEAIRNTFITFGVKLIMFPISMLTSVFLYKKVWGHKVFRILFFLPSLLSGTIIAELYIMLCNNTLGSEGLFSIIVKSLLDLDYFPSLLSEERFANTFVMINLIWIAFPADMIIWSGTLSRIPDSVLESAQLDGVNWWQEVTRIIIPLIWPTFALQSMLLCVGIFGSSGAVFLLTNMGDYGTQTLSNWMFMQIYNQGGYVKNSNVLNYLSAVGLILTSLTWVVVITVKKLTGKMDPEVSF